MERVQELEQKKRKIESELESLINLLTADGMPGLEAPLVDNEGFPRSDCDVYAVRHARHQIATLKTDHTEVCQEIEDALHQIHATSKVRVPRNKRQNASTSFNNVKPKVFAIVDIVHENSPAAVAGLQLGDGIVTCGGVSLDTCSDINECFKQLRSTVQEMEPLFVRVFRDDRVKELNLIPMRWAGQGLLGCHLKPT